MTPTISPLPPRTPQRAPWTLWAPPVRHPLDPRRLVDALDSHRTRRCWGRWPVVRVVIAYGIWLAKYRLRRH
jgi:hypothetical protein